MVQRQKTLATFGAGPFATGDTGGGRFGHYTFDDEAPKLLGILLAEFDNREGPIIKHYVPRGNDEVEATFHFTKALIIPKTSMFRHSFALTIKALDCKVLMFPVGIDHQDYHRGRFTFNMSFIVDMTSSAETMYEPIVQKCAEYLIELEIEYHFLTDSKYRNQLYEVMEKMFIDLSTKGESVIEVVIDEDQIVTLYFKLCPSYRGIEPPEIDYHMVPMFIREVELSPRLIEKMDVLSQKIIPQIDGINTVREIAIILELDPSLVARCVRNLHFYECVSLVPMFLYWNTYVATERVHDFYKNQMEISDCLEFVKIQSATGEDGSEIPMPNPEFSDVFRLYLSMRVPDEDVENGAIPKKSLEQWVAEEKPRSMGIDEHRLVQFGMHHQFLRKLSNYPICTVNPGNNSLLKACNGKTSVDELALTHNIDPGVLHHLLKKSGKFEFVMK
uniref:Nitrogen permease regulator 2-like protein n=1 Tax=Caenorhabditis japonica TaxID=281687 RepID=A0A8R1HXW5_CAEJA